MRLLPALYAVFCLAVLGTFTYAKVEGLSLFSSGTAARNQTGASGGHGAGFLLGGHK